MTELRIVRGGVPDEAELAALTAVIAAKARARPAPEHRLRTPLSPWVASGLVKGTRTKV
ncbi:MAG TPA: acyl-CoA carboxylase epsilon subunit [Mycobacteriales bacterium]|nr:acyl-CoA carboxylase epsilon subunit [Mycobacteriales bacterium]